MTRVKSNKKRITDIILIVLIVVCVGLIMVEMTNNLTTEFERQNPSTTTTMQEDVEPTPRPTLTAEEREEIFSAPIGEDD